MPPNQPDSSPGESWENSSSMRCRRLARASSSSPTSFSQSVDSTRKASVMTVAAFSGALAASISRSPASWYASSDALTEYARPRFSTISNGSREDRPSSNTRRMICSAG